MNKSNYFFALLLTNIQAISQPKIIDNLSNQQDSFAVLKIAGFSKFFQVEMIEEEFDDLEISSRASRNPRDTLRCRTPFFAGVIRRDVKTTILKKKKFQRYAHLQDLLMSLPADSVMNNHIPKIDESPESERVIEEQRNVYIKKTWILAVYREADNDFHVVLGDSSAYSSSIALMNVEFSGLPDSTKQNKRMYSKLKNVRAVIESQLGNLKCGKSYYFLKGGIPVSIGGSLFFDSHHSSTGTGRGGIKPKTVWEIHPVCCFKWLEF
jgi:hypothetical protein